MYHKRGGDIIQNVSKSYNSAPFYLNNYIDKQIESGKKIIYISGGGPVGLYCGIELLRTGKYTVIISEQRKSYTRKQIFFIQYTTLFNSYDNFSQHVKNELEKKGCNIGTPFITRSDNCNEYVNKFDISNNINGKLVSMNVFKLEELFFSEFILKGGIIIKPSSSLDISNNPNALNLKKIDEKLVYKLDDITNKIVCEEGCGFYDDPKIEIDLNKIYLIIDSEGGGSKLRKYIPKNERLYLTYKIKDEKDNTDPFANFEPISENNEDIKLKDTLSHGLLLYLDTSKLSIELINKINLSENESFGISLYDSGFIDKTNNLYKKHFITQNRYRFFASKIDKYEKYFLNFNNLKSPDNHWYLSVMISNNEYSYIKDYLPLSRELQFSKIKLDAGPDNEKINYLEIILFSCFNFYGLINDDIKYLNELLNATTLFIFPVKLFFSISGVAGRHKNNDIPIFSIGDSILGVNYFSGTGVNYGMKYVDKLIHILEQSDNIDSSITEYNKITENSNLKENLSSSILRFIDFKKINIKTIIKNKFSFKFADTAQISYNRVNPCEIEPKPKNVNTQIALKQLQIFDYGLENIEDIDKIKDYIPQIETSIYKIDDLYLYLLEWLKNIFVFNLLRPDYIKHSYNSIYFTNLINMLNKKEYKNNYKINIILNGLSTFIESNLLNQIYESSTTDDNLIYFNNKENLDLGIDENKFIKLNNLPNKDKEEDTEEDNLIKNFDNETDFMNLYLFEDDYYKEICLIDNIENIKEKSSITDNICNIDPFLNHKNIISKFITDIFLTSEKGKINILNLIITLFTNKINEYIKSKQLEDNSIKFIYKGGNIFKILFETYKYISSGLSLLIDKYFSDNFTNSDMDFEILISKENYERKDINIIINDLTKMSYVLLFDIRIELYKNIDNYIDYFKFTPGIQKNYLKNILSNLNKIDDSKLTFINIVFSGNYSNYKLNYDNSRFDLLITKGKEQELVYGYISNPYTKELNKNNFYISVNNSIDKFNLIRMKVNFISNYCKQNFETKIYKKNLAGEFIDISIFKYNQDINFKEDLTKFTKKDKKENIILEFESYTIKYFIKELFNIIFIETNIKKIKRVNRLIILCFIDAYIQNNFIIDGKFKDFILNMIEILENKKQFEENKKPFEENISIFSNGFGYFMSQLSKNTRISDNLSKNIQFIINSVVIPSLQNLLIIIKDMIDNKIKEDIIYNITQLGGKDNIDYKSKYLKYKNKYIYNKNNN